MFHKTVVVPAGNISQIGPNVSNPALGYNVLSVGNYDDHGNANWTDDEMHDSCYEEPPGSGREEPDVAAPGTNIYTTGATDVDGEGMKNKSGTSLAAPVAAGAIALLMEQNPMLKTWPELSRAIMMASARHNIEGDSRLSEYDGTGGISVKCASELLANGTFATENLLEASCPDYSFIRTYYCNAATGDRVRAVLCWNSHPANNAQYDPDLLLSDLDLKAYDPYGVEVPIGGMSFSLYNNFEIIDFTATMAGEYAIKIFNGHMSHDERIAIAWDARTLHTLNITATSGGTARSPNTHHYNHGEAATLVASPEPSFLNWSGDISQVSNPNYAVTTVTVNGNYNLQANFISFGEALDNASLQFHSASGTRWFSERTTTYYGSDAMQSGDITHNETSSMDTDITGPGTISFYWKVSSQANYDFLEFWADGQKRAQISGETGWQYYTYSVTGPSLHIFEWRYRKDGSVDGGSDCGWVDYVTLSTSPTVGMEIVRVDKADLLLSWLKAILEKISLTMCD
jgi:hypothetical protein